MKPREVLAGILAWRFFLLWNCVTPNFRHCQFLGLAQCEGVIDGLEGRFDDCIARERRTYKGRLAREIEERARRRMRGDADSAIGQHSASEASEPRGERVFPDDQLFQADLSFTERTEPELANRDSIQLPEQEDDMPSSPGPHVPPPGNSADLDRAVNQEHALGGLRTGMETRALRRGKDAAALRDDRKRHGTRECAVRRGLRTLSHVDVGWEKDDEAKGWIPAPCPEHPGQKGGGHSGGG